MRLGGLLSSQEASVALGLITSCNSYASFVLSSLPCASITPATPRLAEITLETSYPPRRIIRQTDNLFKYKSEDEFRRIICLDIYLLTPGNTAKIWKPVPLMWKLRQKNRLRSA